MNINLLLKLVKQNSYSFNKEGVDAVGEIMKEELSFMKIEEVPHPTMGKLITFRSHVERPNHPKILLSGHSDTVFPPDVKMNIYKDGNKLYGPGTQDMKGGLFVIINVLKTLEKTNELFNIDFILDPDEENQSRAHRDTVSQLYKKYDIALVFEASTSNINGEKYSPERRSIVISRKSHQFGFATITSPGGHSGVITEKKLRANSILEAAHKITALEGLADYEKGSILNTGLIKGGIEGNVLAPECTFKFEYRCENEEEEKRLEEGVSKIMKKTFVPGTKTEITYGLRFPPMSHSEEKKVYVDELIKIGQDMGIDIHTERRGGGSDANVISGSNVIALDGFGPQGDGEHSKHEFLYLDSIEPSIKLTLEFLRQLQQKTN